jgi:hypothetical protein
VCVIETTERLLPFYYFHSIVRAIQRAAHDDVHWKWQVKLQKSERERNNFIIFNIILCGWWHKSKIKKRQKSLLVSLLFVCMGLFMNHRPYAGRQRNPIISFHKANINHLAAAATAAAAAAVF